MKFFVAKVNLAEQAKLPACRTCARCRSRSNRRSFMLPVRLGTVMRMGRRTSCVYVLTRKGRVETTNYRTTRLPANMDLPCLRCAESSRRLYQAMFARAGGE